MKTFNLIAKIVAALAAVAGIVYIVATYGDKIVAWAKRLLGKCECSCEECDCEGCEECCSECEGCEKAEEFVEAEEAEETEEAAEATEATEETVTAEEKDFENH